MKLKQEMAMEELLALPVSIDLRTAARALGIGQRKVYDYALAGEIPWDPPIPVRRLGSGYRVTRPDLFRGLGLDPAMTSAPEAEAS